MLHVLYGSVAMREECGVLVFKTRVPREIFGPKREEVISDWRKVHYEELYLLC
jgi:hypothetical protein